MLNLNRLIFPSLEDSTNSNIKHDRVLDSKAAAVINWISLAGLVVCLVFFVYSLVIDDRNKFDAALGIPVFILILNLNYRRNFKMARPVFFYGIVAILTFWCFRNRQMGIEYTLITMACASGFIFKKKSEILFGMFVCMCCYGGYYVYDYYTIFTPDPVINYMINPLIFMSISGGIVCAIILTFRKITDKYSVQLEEGYQSLSDAFTQLKENQEKLVQEKQKAEAASRAKSEFLANMSHEIRTPLNGVIGFSDLLIRTKMTEQQNQYLNAITQSGNLLLDIINDILDFSKIEAGKLELSVEKVDLLEMVNQLSDMIRFQAHQKKLELLLNISGNMPRFVWCDEVRLRQVLVNLLANAVKFTEEGEIELKIEVTEKTAESSVQLKFSIRDTGVGIAEKNLDKIFDAFSQEDASTTKRFGGTGLGLTISNKLLGHMGSKLHLQSKPNKGSTFSFDVSFKCEAGSIINYEEVCNVKKVLIVDDNTSNREIMQGMLNLRQIQYDSVSNGNKALELLKAGNKYDVIVMDYNMPEIDGIATIRRIKEFYGDGYQQPVTLLFSSSDDVKLQAACKELQISHSLVKPVKINQFYRALASINLPGKAGATIHHVQPQTDTAAVALNGNNCTVLIAEDNSFNMKMAKAMLKFIIPDAAVIEAKNGKECLDFFTIHKPDIILMDIQMPEMNGYDAANAIREIDTEIPIIALTAGSIAGEKEKCLAAGMSDYIAKPFIKDTLHKMMEKWLAAVC